jgi:hypothetical protein
MRAERDKFLDLYRRATELICEIVYEDNSEGITEDE